MGRTTPTLRQFIQDEWQEWIRTSVILSEKERKALKDLLNAALVMSDVGSLVPNPVPIVTMFMLMLIHLDARLNEIERRLEKK